MQLIPASSTIPKGLEAMLSELADGEAGFSGSTFYVNQLSLAEYLQECHYLNDFLRTMGGHIGYYVKPSARGNGYAAQALKLALPELAKLGQDKALITVSPDNLASIKTVLSCGGVCTDNFTDDNGNIFNHYWIDL